MAEKGRLLGYLFTVTAYKFEITTTVLITKNFDNKKGTIYGNRLPQCMKVKKGWEPLLWTNDQPYAETST